MPNPFGCYHPYFHFRDEPTDRERLREAYRALSESSNQIATLATQCDHAQRRQHEAETARDANARAVVSQAETIEHLRRELATQRLCTAAERARADRLHLAQTQQVLAQARFASLVKERDDLLATARRLESENAELKPAAAQACEAGRIAQLWQDRARASNATKNALRVLLRKMERRAVKAEAAANRHPVRSFAPALRDLIDCRKAQDAKWGQQDHAADKWVSILAEEVGELAKAVNDRAPDGECRDEALDCAAVAIAIVEAIDRLPTPCAQ